MIIFSALKEECSEFISHYKLKRVDHKGRFAFYSGQGPDLVICGPGAVNIAAAVGTVLGNGREDQLLLYGTCGSLAPVKPDLYHINKLYNLDSGRVFYPDLLIKSDIPEASIMSGSRVITEEKNFSGDGDLYDMEAAFFYEAALIFSRQDKIHIFKCVTDRVVGKLSPREDFIETASYNARKLFPYIDSLLELEKEEKDMPDPREDEILDRLKGLLKMSLAMERDMRKIVRYCLLSGRDINKTTDRLVAEGLLPVRDRRTGKEIIDRNYRTLC